MWRSHLAVQITPRATLGKYNLDAMVPPAGGPIRLIDLVFGEKLIPAFGSLVFARIPRAGARGGMAF